MGSQALGMIVAKSQQIANEAVKLVKVQYTDMRKPIVTLEDAMAANSFFPIPFTPVVCYI